MTSIDKIIALSQSQPRLDAADSAAYDKIYARLRRAEGDLRRATKRADAKKIELAKRAIARARDARDAFCAPRVGHLYAPQHVIAKFEAHWSGPSGSGIHRQECEMVLDHIDISGPQYRTTRVLKDEGGPPTGARGAPGLLGVAWFAVRDHIDRGVLVVLDEEAIS